jgi:hypothetical protein
MRYMNRWGRYLVVGRARANKQSGQLEPKHGEGVSLSSGRGQDGPYREVLQKIATQVCINVIQEIGIAPRLIVGM